MRLAISLLTLTAAAAFGQNTAPLPSFEVASVKVSAPLPNGMVRISMGGLGSTDPGRLNYPGATLRSLIAEAYHVKEYQVEGPAWLDSEHYDIMATMAAGTTKEEVRLMMQRLLAERFKVTLHHEAKSLPVYVLSVGKGGAKLKEVDPAVVAAMPSGRGMAAGAPPPPPPPPGAAGHGSMQGGGVTMRMGMTNRELRGSLTLTRLCDMLSNFLDRPVVDLTELTATYDLDLIWTPDENERMGGKIGAAMASAHAAAGAPMPSSTAAPDGASDPGLSLAQSLQVNYGLKLEARKNPADVLVIDHADKVPTEN